MTTNAWYKLCRLGEQSGEQRFIYRNDMWYKCSDSSPLGKDGYFSIRSYSKYAHHVSLTLKLDQQGTTNTIYVISRFVLRSFRAGMGEMALKGDTPSQYNLERIVPVWVEKEDDTLGLVIHLYEELPMHYQLANVHFYIFHENEEHGEYRLRPEAEWNTIKAQIEAEVANQGNQQAPNS